MRERLQFGYRLAGGEAVRALAHRADDRRRFRRARAGRDVVVDVSGMGQLFGTGPYAPLPEHLLADRPVDAHGFLRRLTATDGPVVVELPAAGPLQEKRSPIYRAMSR